MLYAHWRISAHPGRGRPGGDTQDNNPKPAFDFAKLCVKTLWDRPSQQSAYVRKMRGKFRDRHPFGCLPVGRMWPMTSGLFYIIMLSYLQRRCYVSSLSTTNIVRPENGFKSKTSLSPTSLFWLGPLTGFPNACRLSCVYGRHT